MLYVCFPQKPNEILNKQDGFNFKQWVLISFFFSNSQK